MGDELRHYHEEKTDTAKELYVKHMAWRKLFKLPESERVLKQLIDTKGVDRVKKTFNETSHIEEITRG